MTEICKICKYPLDKERSKKNENCDCVFHVRCMYERTTEYGLWRCPKCYKKIPKPKPNLFE